MSAARVRPEAYRWNGTLVGIAASTGGVEAIGQILAAFPADGPPVLVVQHMPCGITALFADRIDRHSPPHVVEAAHDMPILQGWVYVAPGGKQHLTVAGTEPLRCQLVDAPPARGHRPSADRLFESMAALSACQTLGVILTGMGDDGAQGLLQLRRAGMPTLGQDQASALIYGMPRAAAECGAVEQVLPLDRIAGRILELCQC